MTTNATMQRAGAESAAAELPERRLSVDPLASPARFKEQAYAAIRNAIAAMDVYRTRDEIRLDERRLAHDFGISRTPVREAMAQLEREGFVRSVPRRGVYVVRKNKREGRLLLDISRNAYAQLVVAPYTVRATPDARVATPLDWSELDDEDLSPQRFTVQTMARRLDEPDPWDRTRMPRPVPSLSTARQRLGDLPT